MQAAPTSIAPAPVAPRRPATSGAALGSSSSAVVVATSTRSTSAARDARACQGVARPAAAASDSVRSPSAATWRECTPVRRSIQPSPGPGRRATPPLGTTCSGTAAPTAAMPAVRSAPAPGGAGMAWACALGTRGLGGVGAGGLRVGERCAAPGRSAPCRGRSPRTGARRGGAGRADHVDPADRAESVHRPARRARRRTDARSRTRSRGCGARARSTSASTRRKPSTAGSICGEWKAPATGSGVLRMPSAAASAALERVRGRPAPPGGGSCRWPGHAAVRAPAARPRRASRFTAIMPASDASAASCISRPRAATTAGRPRGLSAPAAARAVISPSEWPARADRLSSPRPCPPRRPAPRSTGRAAGRRWPRRRGRRGRRRTARRPAPPASGSAASAASRMPGRWLPWPGNSTAVGVVALVTHPTRSPPTPPGNAARPPYPPAGGSGGE